jgi:hypothetical protein
MRNHDFHSTREEEERDLGDDKYSLAANETDVQMEREGRTKGDPRRPEEFAFRGQPKSGPLRVQAAISRAAVNTIPDRTPTRQRRYSNTRDSYDDVNQGFDRFLGGGGDGDESGNEHVETPTAVRRMREEYERRASEHPQTEEGIPWAKRAANIYTSEELPPWVEKLRPPVLPGDGSAGGVAGKNQPFDDGVSVHSTPPGEKHASSKLRLAAAGVLDATRVRAATDAFRWLSRLGLCAPGIPPLEVHDGGRVTIPSLTDGVLLCKLIQRLERSGALPGFTAYPRSRAQKLQNIRKVLEVLSRKKRIPLSSLAIEEEIIEGNATVVVDLLHRIKDVYKAQSHFAQ